MKPLLVCGWLFFAAATAWAFDLKRMPAESDVEALAVEGWPAAAQRLSKGLAEAYTPGKNGRPGSSGDPAFGAWLDLWKGCELLSTSCESQTTALVQRHFFKERDTGKIFFPRDRSRPPRLHQSTPRKPPRWRRIRKSVF